MQQLSTYVIQFIAIMYVAFLAWRGLLGGPRFASWHMFAWSERSTIDLKYLDKNGTLCRLNHWDYLPHTAIVGNVLLLKFLIYYLRNIRGLMVFGTATIFMSGELLRIKIQENSITIKKVAYVASK